MKQAQRSLNAHTVGYNLFNLGRHLVSAETFQSLYYAPLRLGKCSDVLDEIRSNYWALGLLTWQYLRAG
jgi:hypothetical protein